MLETLEVLCGGPTMHRLAHSIELYRENLNLLPEETVSAAHTHTHTHTMPEVFEKTLSGTIASYDPLNVTGSSPFSAPLEMAVV